MRRHLGVGSIDLGVVEAGLDDGGLGVVRHDEFGNAADRLEGAHVGVDPVGQRLRPARLGEGEAQGAGDQFVSVVEARGDAMQVADEGALAAAHHAKPDPAVPQGVAASLDRHRPASVISVRARAESSHDRLRRRRNRRTSFRSHG